MIDEKFRRQLDVASEIVSQWPLWKQTSLIVTAMSNNQSTQPESLKQADVAVLCVSLKSIYKQMEGVECYDESRDVRTFNGGMPVVAHPPCRSWSAFCAHQAKPLLGEKEIGPLCVDWVKKCGGVLEHPAHSRLWKHCGLPKPGCAAVDGLWSIEVSQAWWGDSRTKKTWLLFSGVERVHVPMCPHNATGDRRRWQLMSKTQRAATNENFAKWLVGVARKSVEESARMQKDAREWTAGA